MDDERQASMQTPEDANLDVDLAGTIVPPMRQLQRALKIFRELKRISRSALDATVRVRSERWQTYAYCDSECDWLIDVLPELENSVDALVDDFELERDESGGKRSRDSDDEYFVYLYRHKDGRPMYVGYGKDPSRALFHVSGSHNDSLNNFLNSGEFDLSIAGPFGTEEMGRAIETALISTLRPECNIAPGPSNWQFRPIGVPGKFVHRPGLPPMMREDLIQVMDQHSYSSILFVLLNDQAFDDGRLGYDIANPPLDEVVYERMRKWWYVGRYVPGWVADNVTGPGLLVAVTGSFKHRLIAGCVEIDRAGWANAVWNEDAPLQFTVPVLAPSDLDACKLRGRRIAVEADLKFNTIWQEMFLLLNRDGSVIGGRSQKAR